MAAPTDKVTFRGATINRATRAFLLWVEEQLAFHVEIVQGSYRPVSNVSGSTHTGGGVVDLRTRDLTTAQRTRLLRRCRDGGSAAWLRDERDGFDPHLHLCIYGDGAQDMAPSAQRQRLAYDKGLSGLDSGKADRNTYRPDPRVKWSWSLDKPVRR